MTEHDESSEIPATVEEEAAAATEVGIDAIRRIHLIEREMLSRAVQAIVGMTEKSPRDVMRILSEGLDEGYTAAMEQAYAREDLTAGLPKKELTVPKLVIP